MLIQCSLWKYNKFGEESDVEWSNWESLKEVWIKHEQEWWDVHFLFSKNTEAEIIRTCMWHKDRTWGCPLGRFKKWTHSSIGRTSYQELVSYERSWKPHRILILVFLRTVISDISKSPSELMALPTRTPIPPATLLSDKLFCPPFSDLVEIKVVHSLVIWGLHKMLITGANRRSTTFFPLSKPFKNLQYNLSSLFHRRHVIFNMKDVKRAISE